MVRVLAVNNYSAAKRFERLTRCLERNGAEVSIADWRDASAPLFDRFDGVVLSGSPDMLSSPKDRLKYAAEIDAIPGTKAAVLGTCYGHQLMAVAFGSEVVKDTRHVLRFVRTDPLSEDPLFEGLRRPMMLLESRHEVVKSLPEGFDLIAQSETTKIAAMKHRKRPLYGVQFHPERFTAKNPDGNAVVANFIRILG